jgi:hypothetical protein
MGLVFAGLPDWILEFVENETRIQLAIETGTFLGESAQMLSGSFETVYTIEAAPELFHHSTKRFLENKKVTVFLGSSLNVLPDLMTTLNVPAFYWLDAHYSGDVTSGESQPCPLLSEIRIISTQDKFDESIVVIDDARLFGGPHDLAPTMHGWPRLYEVLDNLERVNKKTFVIDDVIVGIPVNLEESFLLFATSKMKTATWRKN